MNAHIVELIVFNAFNGMGDSSGSDDFGYSFAWIDVNDFMEDFDVKGRDTDDISREAREYLDGNRYAIAYIDSDGSRSAVAYSSHADVMHAYRALESEFLAYEESVDSE